MKKVRIILKQDVEGLGKEGEIVTVKYGYAANYLIPRGYAVLATESNIRHWQSIMEMRRRKLERLREKAEELRKKLEKTRIVIPVKVGEEDRLYGSVTARDIHERLKYDFPQIDRRDILLEEPIKALGTYEVPVRLHPDVVAHVKVEVVKEE